MKTTKLLEALKSEPPHLYIENIIRKLCRKKSVSLEKTLYSTIKKRLYFLSPKFIKNKINIELYLKNNPTPINIIYIHLKNNLENNWITQKKHAKYSINQHYIATFIDFKNLLSDDKHKYYVLLEKEMMLTKEGLYEITKYIHSNVNNKIFYTDHSAFVDDKFTHHCKPSFNIDFFLAYNYIQSPIIIEQSILKKLINLGSFESNLSLFYYSLLLLAYQNKIEIKRLQKMTAKCINPSLHESNDTSIKRRAIVNSYLKNEQINALVELVDDDVFYIKRKLTHTPKVSIIIPFKDKLELLTSCVDSILKETDYPNYEILLVSNNSEDENTFNYIKNLQSEHNHIHFFEYNKTFNYSAINNFAASKTEAPYLLFLNNDTKVINRGWLRNMCMHLQRDDVGVVGCLLLYEDDTIQHAGVTIGVGHFAGHNHRNFHKDEHGYMNRIIAEHEVSAVTGACLLTKRSLFQRVKGFNETNLGISNNDVDYCLKVRQRNKKVIYTPKATLYHYESKSRSPDLDDNNIQRYKRELEYMKKTYQSYEDPFYNRSLTKDTENFNLRK